MTVTKTSQFLEDINSCFYTPFMDTNNEYASIISKAQNSSTILDRVKYISDDNQSKIIREVMDKIPTWRVVSNSQTSLPFLILGIQF